MLSETGIHELGAPESTLVRLSARPDLLEEVYEVRRKHADREGWDKSKAQDPDVYDTDSEFLTDSVAIVSNTGDGIRTSLRLTKLPQRDDGLPDECLSLDMLGDNTPLQTSAVERLGEALGVEDVVYDMTRFVVDSDKYAGDLRQAHQYAIDDFLKMIGGAVDMTDVDALNQNLAVWVFTAEPKLKRLLEYHDIKPEVLAEGESDEGVTLQFCMIRPHESFCEVREGKSERAKKAAHLISLGRRAAADCVKGGEGES